MELYTSANLIPVDEPFAKLILNNPTLSFYAGIPAISSSDYPESVKAQYVIAANALGLNSNNSNYVAKRIRHLAYCIRNSKFAESINWRSCLADIDRLIPVIEEPLGLTQITSTPNIKYSLTIIDTLSTTELDWDVSVSGVGQSPIQMYVNGQAAGATWTTGSSARIPVGGSGYAMQFNLISIGNGDSVSFNAKLLLPYVANLADTYATIKNMLDFINQIAYNKKEYLDAIFNGDSVEDAIAAFILSVNELK